MSRSCRGFLLSISALADDNLDAASAPAVRAHLAECPDCARVYQEQRELSDWLRAGSPDLEPAPELWTRIESRLELPRRSLWQQLGSGLAAVLRFPSFGTWRPACSCWQFSPAGSWDGSRRRSRCLESTPRRRTPSWWH